MTELPPNVFTIGPDVQFCKRNLTAYVHNYYSDYDPVVGVRIAISLSVIILLFALFIIYKSYCNAKRTKRFLEMSIRRTSSRRKSGQDSSAAAAAGPASGSGRRRSRSRSRSRDRHSTRKSDPRERGSRQDDCHSGLGRRSGGGAGGRTGSSQGESLVIE